MKTNLLALLLLGALFCSTNSNAQARLYMGYINGSYGDSLAIIDTTGGLSIVEHRLLTTDFTSPVNGCYGLSMHPTTGDMYILYGLGSNTTRRLGILDTLSASINDIGMAGSGNLTDIEFYGNTLYGTTGSSSPSYDVVSIDLATAATTTMMTIGLHGPSLLHNTFKDSLFKFDRNGVFNINTNTNTGVEIDLLFGSEILGAVMKNDSVAIVAHFNGLYEYNFNNPSAFSTLLADRLMTTQRDINALEFGTPFSAVGVEELSSTEQSLDIFPNPTSDILNIHFEGRFEYTVVNIDGKTVLSGKGIDNKEISMKELPKGSYLIVTTNSKGKATAQVIKN